MFLYRLDERELHIDVIVEAKEFSLANGIAMPLVDDVHSAYRASC